MQLSFLAPPGELTLNKDLTYCSNLGFYNRKIKMESLSDVASFSTKLQNTLIQYHSIEEDKWRVAKKMVNICNHCLGV